MPSGRSYPVTTVNEPGSVLVPGESFSPWIEYYALTPFMPSPAAEPTAVTIEVPPATTLIAPAAVPQSGGLDWITLLIIGGILLIILGGSNS